MYATFVESSDPLGLIVGVCIGCVLLVAAVVAVILSAVIYVKWRSMHPKVPLQTVNNDDIEVNENVYQPSKVQLYSAKGIMHRYPMSYG